MADSSWSDRIADGFDKVKKVTVGVAAALAGIIVIVAILREATAGGIAIDTVVVRSPDGSLTPELAAQQITRQLDRVQRAGVNEWRRVHVDDGTQSVDLQIPGSPLSVRGLAHEVVALVGLSPRTLRVAIAKSTPSGYAATVSFVGEQGSMTTCQETQDTPDVLDRIYECIARTAIAGVDAKVAASYVFQRERGACTGLNAGVDDFTTVLQREEIRIDNRRRNCGFVQTQALIAQVLGKGRKADLPWVPYIYGQVHLARGVSLPELGLQARLSEFDQAIGRFQDALRLLPDSPSTLAVLMEAYLAKGIAAHESTGRVPWDDKPDSVMQFRLGIAESTLAEAQKRLAQLPLSRSSALAVLIDRQEAVLRYRTWMIKAHRRTHRGDVTVSNGQPEENDLLTVAAARLADAEDRGPLSSLDYMYWGNILRALGKYDEAVAKYRMAADLAPGNSDPALNIAIAYIDRVGFGPPVARPGDVLTALGALSDYLAWMTGGGPYTTIVERTRTMLGHTGAEVDLAEFDACYRTGFAAEPASTMPVDRWRAAATYKICVDAAIDRVNARLRGATTP
jgi:tetratricopeptide (TPR) repeat protein